MKSSPMYEKLVRDSTPSGGLAFHTEDSRRPDIEFVPVAYDKLPDGCLEELDKQMKLIAKGDRRKSLTGGQQRQRRRPMNRHDRAKAMELREKMLRDGKNTRAEQDDLDDRFERAFRRASFDDESDASDGSDDSLSSDASAETCLLYTSPSPRDKRQSRMPSSA